MLLALLRFDSILTVLDPKLVGGVNSKKYEDLWDQSSEVQVEHQHNI